MWFDVKCDCLNLQSVINNESIMSSSRNLTEAKRLLNAKMIISFGKTKITEIQINIVFWSVERWT